MKKYDIIVAGGGFAGAAAAVSAARLGKNVLLFDKANALGGAACNCLVNPFMPYRTKIDGKTTRLSSGLFEEIQKRLLEVRNELSELFRILIHMSEKNMSARPAASIAQETRLRDILLFIHDHYAEKITLDDMAAAAFISKSEVLRCFRNITGQSPFEYLKNYRLRNAAYMIQNTSDPINTICGLCGFDDHSYFSKAFKEVYGCSPREFKK